MCDFGKFKNREFEDVDDDDDGLPLEIDSFSFMTRDTLEPSQSYPALGIYVVSANDIEKEQSRGAGKESLQNSPDVAVAANLGQKVTKYIIGECYSGDKKHKIMEKVQEGWKTDPCVATACILALLCDTLYGVQNERALISTQCGTPQSIERTEPLPTKPSVFL